MKTLLVMVLTMGLAVASVEAHDDDNDKRREARRALLVWSDDEQPRSVGWLQGLGITPEQWGQLKAQRLKTRRVMKLAHSALEDSIKVILTEEQQAALKERREGMRQRAKQWSGRRHKALPNRHKLHEKWKEWHEKAHNDEE